MNRTGTPEAPQRLVLPLVEVFFGVSDGLVPIDGMDVAHHGRAVAES